MYHLLFETRNRVGILTTEDDGLFILSEAGCSFLDTVGESLQHFPCLRIHAMSIRPSEIEMLIEINEWRNRQNERERGTPEWIQLRRTMTLPVFVGY